MNGYLNVIGSVSPSQQEWNEWPYEIGGFVDGPPPSHTRCVTSPWSLGIGWTHASGRNYCQTTGRTNFGSGSTEPGRGLGPLLQ